MTEIETTTAMEQDPTSTQWLAGPPPPPPATPGGGSAPGQEEAAAAEGERGMATHSPLSQDSLRSASVHLRAESPWMLGSAGILAALGAYWASSVIAAFEHGHGITAQERVLRVLTPGTLIWVLGAILAAALYSAGRRFEVPAARPGPLRAPLAMGLVVAGAVAVASAALSMLVELSNFGHGIAATFAGMVGYLGSLVLAGVLAWWTNQEHDLSARA
jgi:MFS family permease